MAVLHVVGGFLGAGKTTLLLDQLARREGESIAVVVNDFGEAQLDGTSLGERTGNLRSIPGGCVCCTAPEGLTDALKGLLDEVAPDRIFVEPTGLARPQDIVDTVARGPLRDRLTVGPVVVLVDPGTVDPTALSANPLLRQQVEAADVLVASKVDLASEAALARFDTWAGELWPPKLAVLHAEQGRIGLERFDWPEGQGPRRELGADEHHHHHHHDHRGLGPSSEGYRAASWVWSAGELFSRDRLVDALARAVTGRAGAPLARLKGLFRTDQGWVRLEVAGGRVDDRPTSYRRDSRCDVILQTEAQAPLDTIGAWLDAARMTEAERAVDSSVVTVALPDGTERRFTLDDVAALPGAVADVSQLVPKYAGQAASVRALLRAAEAPAEGSVVVVAADGMVTEPVPLSSLSEAVLVHTLDGGPLSAGKGGPFRLLIPGDAGPGGPCANVKKVVRVVVRG